MFLARVASCFLAGFAFRKRSKSFFRGTTFYFVLGYDTVSTFVAHLPEAITPPELRVRFHVRGVREMILVFGS